MTLGHGVGGRRRILAVIKDERVTCRILEHFGLPSEALPLEKAEQTPQGELWPTGPPHDAYAQPPAPEEYDQCASTFDFAQ